MTRCTSPICIVRDGIRGREFTPPKDAQGIAKVWCSDCIKIANQMKFFSSQTATMIRNVYQEYINTELPKEVKLILEQFAREIITNMNEEL